MEAVSGTTSSAFAGSTGGWKEQSGHIFRAAGCRIVSRRKQQKIPTYPVAYPNDGFGPYLLVDETLFARDKGRQPG